MSLCNETICHENGTKTGTQKNISKIDLCYKILEVTIEKLADTHIPTRCDLYITFLRDSPTGINPMSVSQKIFPRSNSLCL